MSRIHFLYMPVYIPQIFLLIFEVPLGSGYHQLDHKHRERQHYKGRDGHNDTDTQHHNEDPYDRRKTGDHLRKTQGQCLVYRFDIVYHPALDLSVRLPVKVFQRQAIQLLRHGITQFIDDRLGNIRHDPALQCSKQQAEAIHAQQHHQNMKQTRKIDAGSAHQTFHYLVRRIPQDRRRNNIEHCTCDGENKYGYQCEFMRRQITHQFFHGSLEIFRLFSRHHLAAGAVSASALFPHSVKSGASRSFSRIGICHYFRPLSSSSSLSCDNAISLYTSQDCIRSS